MELTQLIYFAAVAESLHMTRTAERLHVAQPALSQAISRLEKELGVPLFNREGRSLTLTAYGTHLRDRLRGPLDTLKRLPTELRELEGNERHTVRLSVMAATSMVTDAIIAYRGEHPEARFMLVQSTDKSEFDISVTTEAEPVTGERICCFEERIFLIVPAEGVWGKRKEIRLADVAEENFISLAGTRRLRGICDRYCMQAGFTPRLGFQSDNPASVKKLIASHAGVGFWPEFSWGPCADHDVAYLPIIDPECRRSIVLSCSKRQGNEEAESFFAFLVDFIARRRDAQPGSKWTE